MSYINTVHKNFYRNIRMEPVPKNNPIKEWYNKRQKYHKTWIVTHKRCDLFVDGILCM